MAGIEATVTTDKGLSAPMAEEPKRRGRPAKEEGEKIKTRRRKDSADKRDLDHCRACSAKIEAFVAGDGWRFCNDSCLRDYMA